MQKRSPEQYAYRYRCLEYFAHSFIPFRTSHTCFITRNFIVLFPFPSISWGKKKDSQPRKGHGNMLIQGKLTQIRGVDLGRKNGGSLNAFDVRSAA